MLYDDDSPILVPVCSDIATCFAKFLVWTLTKKVSRWYLSAGIFILLPWGDSPLTILVGFAVAYTSFGDRRVKYISAVWTRSTFACPFVNWPYLVLTTVPLPWLSSTDPQPELQTRT